MAVEVGNGGFVSYLFVLVVLEVMMADPEYHGRTTDFDDDGVGYDEQQQQMRGSRDE
jgi:hypothetical protein